MEKCPVDSNSFIYRLIHHYVNWTCINLIGVTPTSSPELLDLLVWLKDHFKNVDSFNLKEFNQLLFLILFIVLPKLLSNIIDLINLRQNYEVIFFFTQPEKDMLDRLDLFEFSLWIHGLRH